MKNMIVYQVRIIVNPGIYKEWLNWMRKVHVPDVIATGLVSSFQVWRAENLEAIEYQYNYYFANQADFDEYQKAHAPKLKAHSLERFPNQFEATRLIFYQL